MEPTTTICGLTSVLRNLKHLAEKRLKKECPIESRTYFEKQRERADKIIKEMKREKEETKR